MRNFRYVLTFSQFCTCQLSGVGSLLGSLFGLRLAFKLWLRWDGFLLSGIRFVHGGEVFIRIVSAYAGIKPIILWHSSEFGPGRLLQLIFASFSLLLALLTGLVLLVEEGEVVWVLLLSIGPFSQPIVRTL